MQTITFLQSFFLLICKWKDVKIVIIIHYQVKVHLALRAINLFSRIGPPCLITKKFSLQLKENFFNAPYLHIIKSLSIFHLLTVCNVFRKLSFVITRKLFPRYDSDYHFYSLIFNPVITFDNFFFLISFIKIFLISQIISYDSPRGGVSVRNLTYILFIEIFLY